MTLMLHGGERVEDRVGELLVVERSSHLTVIAAVVVVVVVVVVVIDGGGQIADVVLVLGDEEASGRIRICRHAEHVVGLVVLVAVAVAVVVLQLDILRRVGGVCGGRLVGGVCGRLRARRWLCSHVRSSQFGGEKTRRRRVERVIALRRRLPVHCAAAQLHSRHRLTHERHRMLHHIAFDAAAAAR